MGILVSIGRFVTSAKVSSRLVKARRYLMVIGGRIHRYLCGASSDALITIEKHRIQLSDRLMSEFDGTIRYGPFRGMKLPEAWSWGPGDRAPMLLGIYEQELLDALVSSSSSGDRTELVVIGAGDGYYGVGAVFCGLFEKSVNFEVRAQGRLAISRLSKLNGVEAVVSVKGCATSGFWRELDIEFGKSVIIVDIEGGEFGLFRENDFEALRHAIIFVELHSFRDTAGRGLAQLLEVSKRTHSVKRITHSGRNLYGIPELDGYVETEIWLLCSEGRPCLMEWLHFEPLAHGSP